jgi:multidrug resistance efflux pump
VTGQTKVNGQDRPIAAPPPAPRTAHPAPSSLGEVTAAPGEETSEAVSELFQELPPVVARGLVYLLLALLLVAGVASFLVTVPELVAAPATVVPQDLVRQLQPAAAGRVSRVAVQEGDAVRANQVLIYLETEVAQAQLERARQEQTIRQRQLQDQLASQADASQVAEARARLAQAEVAVAEAERALDASMILAPSDGQVTRLTVRGPGQVVQAGQIVAEMAPANAPLIFEARLPLDSIGRVRLGQTARIKLDAYPFQQYGTLEGTLTYLSADAVTEGNAPPSYRAIVVPAARPEDPAARKIVLRLGLSATVEIVAKRRRLIELFFRGRDGG